MLGIDFRYAVAKDRAVNAGNVILIEQALIAVNYADGLVIVANDFFLQAQIVNYRIHFSALGKFNCLIHELLVPSFRANLCPELFGCHIDDVKDVGRFLRINRIRWPKYVLIGSEGFDAWLIDHSAGYGYRSLSILTQLSEHSASLGLGNIELFVQSGGQFIVHTSVLYRSCNLWKGLSNLIKLNGLLLLEVLRVPVAIMHHHALLIKMIESKFHFIIELLHFSIEHPTHEITDDVGTLDVIGFHGCGDDMGTSDGIERHGHERVDRFIHHAHFLITRPFPREDLSGLAQTTMLLVIVTLSIPQTVPSVVISLSTIHPFAQVALGTTISFLQVSNIGFLGNEQ